MNNNRRIEVGSALAIARESMRVAELDLHTVLQRATAAEDVALDMLLTPHLKSVLDTVVVITHLCPAYDVPHPDALAVAKRELDTVTAFAIEQELHPDPKPKGIYRPMPLPAPLLWPEQFGPTYKVPEVLTRYFTDVSWGNDGCPSFALPGCGVTVVNIWSEEPDSQGRQGYWISDEVTGSDTHTFMETNHLTDVLRLMLAPLDELQAEEWLRAIVRLFGEYNPEVPFLSNLAAWSACSTELANHWQLCRHNCELILGLESCRSITLNEIGSLHAE